MKDTEPRFLPTDAMYFIDGSNLMGFDTDFIEVRRGGKRYRDPIKPRLDLVESLVSHFLTESVPFLLFFDGSAIKWMQNADNRGEGNNLVRRFQNLRTFGEAAGWLKVFERGEADSPVLAEALEMHRTGRKVFVLSEDKYREHRIKFAQLFRDGSKKNNGEFVPDVLRTPYLTHNKTLYFFMPDGCDPIGIRVEPCDFSADARKQPASQPAPETTGLQRATVTPMKPRPRDTPIVRPPQAQITLPGFRIRVASPHVKVNLQSALAMTFIDDWTLTIGVDTDCDLIVDPSQKWVSGCHALIANSARGFAVTDTSRNGTYLGTRLLKKGVAMRLPADGAVLSLVDASGTSDDAIDFFVEAVSASLSPDSNSPSDENPAGFKASETKTSLGRVNFQFADGSEDSCEITRLPFLIGTQVSGEHSYCLARGRARGVSSEHLKIVATCHPHGFEVKNTGDRSNGTSRRGQKEAGQFVWQFATKGALDEQAITLADASDDSDGKPLQPVIAWLTK